MCCRQFSLNLEVELDNDPGTFGGSTTNRKCTDIFGFLITVLFFGAVIGLSIYCILNSDIEKLTNGYDDQGNICGKNNIKTESMSFEDFGENMDQKKYVFIKIGTKKCVENCTMKGTFLVSNYCVSDAKYVKMKRVLINYAIVWFVVACLALLANTTTKFCYKIFIEQSKYFIPFILFLLLVVLVVVLAFIFNNFYILCLNSISLIILFYMLIQLKCPTYAHDQMFIKLDLINLLYEEVTKTINIMTFALLPLLSSIVITGFIIILNYLWIWLQSFSYLEQINADNETRIDYVQYPIATVTGALGIYAFFLLYEIVKNCQCMIVGGYVSQWYFTPKNGELTKPIERTTLNLLKYHLGTICFGSLILPVVYVVRAVVNAIKGAASGHNKESVYTGSCRLLTETCLATYITCLDFFSQNGFIMTAMHGCSFCAGTSRAHKLISHNSFHLSSIYYIDVYYLEFLKFNCWFFVSFFSFNLRYIVYDFDLIDIVYIGGTSLILSYILADCFISVQQVAKETIFLCFCEDYLCNNGTSKPYNMSPNLAQFIEGANKFVDPVKWKEVADKWEKGPKRLY